MGIDMTQGNQAPGVVGGIYEAVMAVPDLLEAAAFWGCFGFRVMHTGKLDRADAKALYGVNSAVSAIRLGHGKADHGLVRLVSWEKSTGEGLGLVHFRCLGERRAPSVARPTRSEIPPRSVHTQRSVRNTVLSCGCQVQP